VALGIVPGDIDAGCRGKRPGSSRQRAAWPGLNMRAILEMIDAAQAPAAPQPRAAG